MVSMQGTSQPIHDNDDFFSAMGDVYAASRDRIEEVIGQGNLKWVLLILLLLLALWYVRRQRLSSL
jgi:hypothetical protein